MLIESSLLIHVADEENVAQLYPKEISFWLPRISPQLL